MKGGLFQPFLSCPANLALDPDLSLIEVLRNEVASTLILVSPTDFQCKSCSSVITIHSGLESFINWISENLSERLDLCLEILEDDLNLISEFMAYASPPGRLILLKRARNSVVTNYFISKDQTQLLNKKNLLQEEIERLDKNIPKI